MTELPDHVEFFDRTARRFAESIDAAIAGGYYRRGELFVRAAQRWLPRGGRILDYGCGPGRLASCLARAGFHVHGVDSASEMIAEAKRVADPSLGLTFSVRRDYQVKVGDGLGIFDGVVCSSVVEYVDEATGFLRGLREYLRSEGVLILSYANRSSLWRIYEEICYRKTAEYLKFQKHVWNWRTCRQTLESAGFRVLSGPEFFESPLDQSPVFRRFSGLGFVGILGLVAAAKRGFPEADHR